MVVRTIFILAVSLAGFCIPVIYGSANAGSAMATRHAAIRDACTEQGGRFEVTWMYNDQIVRWGDVVSCTTREGLVRCEGKTCRASRWVTGTVGMKTAADRPVSFTDALTTLSGR